MDPYGWEKQGPDNKGRRDHPLTPEKAKDALNREELSSIYKKNAITQESILATCSRENDLKHSSHGKAFGSK